MCLAGVLATGTVHAHHTAAAVFSTDDIEIEGYVTEFNFKNPHLNIILAVTDENGVETEWMATGPGPTPFRRWGWTADTVKPGQFLRIFGRKSRDDGPMLLMEATDIHGGKIVELDPADGTIVRTVAVSSTISRPSRQAETPTAIPTLDLRHSDGRPNLDGMWLGSREGLGRDNPPLNARAAAEQERFDPFEDDPASGPAIQIRMVITDPGNLTSTWEIGTIKYYTAEPYDFVEVDCRLPYRASGQRQSPEGNQGRAERTGRTGGGRR